MSAHLCDRRTAKVVEALAGLVHGGAGKLTGLLAEPVQILGGMLHSETGILANCLLAEVHCTHRLAGPGHDVDSN